jgi:hypothetical protein
MFENRKMGAALQRALLIGLLCLSISLYSSLAVAGTHALTASAESLVVGGSDCSEFLDGFAVGMGVGVLFGCVWCGAGAVIAKGIGLFC